MIWELIEKLREVPALVWVVLVFSLLVAVGITTDGCCMPGTVIDM
jgi:hypothetical protein